MSTHTSHDHPPVTLSEADGVRYLHLGSIWVQGAMRIKNPQVVELEYVRRMLASLLWLPTDAWRGTMAVQLGLGAGAITRFTVQQLGLKTTVVEINPFVIDVCRHWFALPTTDARLALRCADAGAWLATAPAASATLLHVDLYDQEAAAPVLDDEGFYAACRRLLAPGGVMSVNLFGRHASYQQSAARIAKAFGGDQVWSLQATQEGNTTVVAGHAVLVPDAHELKQRAEQLEARYGGLGLKPRQWLKMVRPYQAEAA